MARKHVCQASVLGEAITCPGIDRQPGQAPHHPGVSRDSKLNGPLREADAYDLSEDILEQLGPLPVVQQGPINGVSLVACKENGLRMPDLHKFVQSLVSECFQSRVEGHS